MCGRPGVQVGSVLSESFAVRMIPLKLAPRSAGDRRGVGTTEHARVVLLQASSATQAIAGGKDAEVDFFKVPCKTSRIDARRTALLARRHLRQDPRNEAIARQLEYRAMCELARLSRASFYRSLKEQRPAEEETEVRSAIRQIALEHRRRYGIDGSVRSCVDEECQ
jgi:hypothetical protein